MVYPEHESTHCAAANVLDCKIVVSEFEPLLRHYIYFQINTFGNII